MGASTRTVGVSACFVAVALLALGTGAATARHRHRRSPVVVRSYRGAVQGGGTVSFKARIRGGHVTRVLDFSWHDVPLACAGMFGNSRLSSSGHFGWTAIIRARTHARARWFDVTSYGERQGQGQGWEVKGRFDRGFRQVSGSVYVSDYEPYPQYPGASAHCSTTVNGNPSEEYAPWVARRG